MKWERHFSAGAVVFRREGDSVLYLLLKQPSLGKRKRFFWAFPKGAIEDKETVEAAALREITEETGIIEMRLAPGFKAHEKYMFKSKEGSRVFKIVTYFLAETNQKEAKVSFEHAGYVWVPYEEALAKLSYKGQKEILRKAHEFFLGKFHK